MRFGKVSSTQLRRLAVIALLFSGTISSAICQESLTAIPNASPERGFAFLRQGDLWIHNGTGSHQLTHSGNIVHFAVSEDGQHMVFLNSIPGSQSELTAITEDLEGTRRPRRFVVDSRTRVVATRGTLTLVTSNFAPNGWLSTTKDLIAGEGISETGFDDFRCDMRRQVFAGSDHLRKHYLIFKGFESDPIDVFEAHLEFFDVSPSGEKVAYFTSNVPGVGPRVCVLDGVSSPECLDGEEVRDRLQVSNGEDVIFATSVDEGCFYRDARHYSRKPKPGYNSEDVCGVIGYWRPGMTKTKILEEFADEPQWLNKVSTKTLMAWSQKRMIQH